MNDIRASNRPDDPRSAQNPGPRRVLMERIGPNQPDRLLPRNLRPVIEERDTRLKADLAKQNLTAEDRAVALRDGRSQMYALRDEWVQMQRFLSQNTLDYIAGRPAASIEQLLKIGIFSSVNLDRVDNMQETIKRHIEMVDKWVQIQKIMDANPAQEMRERVNKLDERTMRDFLTGKIPVEDLQDKRDKNSQRRLLEKRDIERLLPFVLSEVENRHIKVIEEKLDQHLRRLAASPREDEQTLAKNMRMLIEKMDAGVYYNMLLGRILPYELRQGLPAEATGVTWELVRTIYPTKDDMRQILQGENLKIWQEGYTRWEATIEQRRPELEREWQTMMDHFYKVRPTTYQRLALMPTEMRYHLLSINLSPEHEIFTLRGHLQQVIATLHPDDLYPFLQYRTEGVESTFGANASWLRFQEIVHKLHDRLETGKTQCIGVDFFTGLPLYLPDEASIVGLGIPGSQKTQKLLSVNLGQHRSTDEVIILVDIKGDSASFSKDLLGKKNLGEVIGLMGGALSQDHRVTMLGPGADEGNINILWYIPTTQAINAEIKQQEKLIQELGNLLGEEQAPKAKAFLEQKLQNAEKERESLTRKQEQMAIKIGTAWAKATVKQSRLENLSHNKADVVTAFHHLIGAAMLHLRLQSPPGKLPRLQDLRFITDPEKLSMLGKSTNSFIQDTYASFQALAPEEKQAVLSLLVESTAVLNSEIVQNFTDDNSLDFEALLRPPKEGEMPWTISVNMHLELNRAELLTPIFESAFEVWHEVHEYAKVHSPEIHSNKLFFMMDEGRNFASNSSSGQVHPRLDEFVDIMRSFNARFFIATQSPDGNLIPTEILGKVVLLIMLPNDTTANYVSERAGVTTRDLASSSSTQQYMMGEGSGTRRPSIGWGFTTTEDRERRDIIQLMQGRTAQELPLIYPHNLTQLSRNLAIMIVPGLAPALYIPLNPRENVVLKAQRRIEPTITRGPVADSLTPLDMKDQLSAPELAPRADAPDSNRIDWTTEDLTQVIESFEREKETIATQTPANYEQGLEQTEGIAQIDQYIKEFRDILKRIQIDDERRRREQKSNNP